MRSESCAPVGPSLRLRIWPSTQAHASAQKQVGEVLHQVGEVALRTRYDKHERAAQAGTKAAVVGAPAPQLWRRRLDRLRRHLLTVAWPQVADMSLAPSMLQPSTIMPTRIVLLDKQAMEVTIYSLVVKLNYTIYSQAVELNAQIQDRPPPPS